MYIDKPKPPVAFILFQFFFISVIAAVLYFGFILSAVINPTALHILLGILFLMLLLNIHAAYNTGYVIKNNYLVAKAGFLITVYSKVEMIESVTRVNNASRLLGWNFGGVQGVANRLNDLVYIRAGKKNFYISPSHIEKFVKAIEKEADKTFLSE